MAKPVSVRGAGDDWSTGDNSALLATRLSRDRMRGAARPLLPLAREMSVLCTTHLALVGAGLVNMACLGTLFVKHTLGLGA